MRTQEPLIKAKGREGGRKGGREGGREKEEEEELDAAGEGRTWRASGTAGRCGRRSH